MVQPPGTCAAEGFALTVSCNKVRDCDTRKADEAATRARRMRLRCGVGGVGGDGGDGGAAAVAHSAPTPRAQLRPAQTHEVILRTDRHSQADSLTKLLGKIYMRNYRLRSSFLARPHCAQDGRAHGQRLPMSGPTPRVDSLTPYELVGGVSSQVPSWLVRCARGCSRPPLCRQPLREEVQS
jgi:hypothetical protein